jgi:hypothetical protein
MPLEGYSHALTRLGCYQDYKGPHLPETITMDTVQTIIKAFSNNILLHPVYAVRIFRLMKKQLKRKCGTINELAIPEVCVNQLDRISRRPLRCNTSPCHDRGLVCE